MTKIEAVIHATMLGNDIVILRALAVLVQGGIMVTTAVLDNHIAASQKLLETLDTIIKEPDYDPPI